MNLIFAGFVLIAFLFSGAQQLGWVTINGSVAPMEVLSNAMVNSATASVDLAIGLIGVMTLFLGLMKVAEQGGLLTILARLIRPLMVRLFPDVPPEHPAMGSMILNMAANAMGLGNAATPFGIRAIQELETLNPTPGTATNAMALFLAINTSSVTLLPTGVIALRAAAGSVNPAGILPTTLFATLGSTATAILAAKLYQRFYPLAKMHDLATHTKAPNMGQDRDLDPPQPDSVAYPTWISVLAVLALICLIPLTILSGKQIAPWILPALMVAFLVFGLVRRVKIYEVFVTGAKEGFQVAVKIIPYLVAILVSVGMLRESGALDIIVNWLGQWTGRLGLPGNVLPMALMRPLSGSGAYGILAAIINNPEIGPDSYAGYLVSTLQGSTETTFYVIAVYYGSIQIRRMRHTLAAALTADAAGIAFAVIACNWLYG
ncbi:MAG: spore maturation protein [Deltaproteobacteria bacterium]|nr:spore maturation protein [Deltaproteobacteria bacterium]